MPGTRRNYGREHEPTTNIHTDTHRPPHIIHIYIYTYIYIVYFSKEGEKRNKTGCTRTHPYEWETLKASWRPRVGQHGPTGRSRASGCSGAETEPRVEEGAVQRINAAKLSNNRLAVFASGSGLKCDMKYGG